MGRRKREEEVTGRRKQEEEETGRVLLRYHLKVLYDSII